MNDDTKTADIDLIQRILPHRYPFLLIDRVVDIDGLRSACGVKNVTVNEPHFQGHFPGNPIMPGVAIVEAMARMVVPGDVLELKLTTLRGKVGGRAWKFGGKAEVGGEPAAEAEFTAVLGMPEEKDVGRGG